MPTTAIGRRSKNPAADEHRVHRPLQRHPLRHVRQTDRLARQLLRRQQFHPAANRDRVLQGRTAWFELRKGSRGRASRPRNQTLGSSDDDDRPADLHASGYGFNGEWNRYDPEYYRLAFRRIKSIIDELHCQNISLVWSYNPAAIDKDYLKYYPGDDCVDWWGIDIFQTPEESAPYTYTFLEDAMAHHKPVMLGEATAFRYGATLEGWHKWFVSFFNYIKTNPVIKAACYINWDWTKYAKWSGWGDCRIESNKDLTKLYRNEMKDPVWLNDTDRELIKKLLKYEQN
ncbi:MAG: glycoside hydrolase family 26 protein [Bacillus subtilis]|nr:glycoside hydrolase family 26 protein [Bacillus subtilis]